MPAFRRAIVLALPLLAAAASRAADLPAFPGAEGFGATTAHARGKPVFRVTRLDDVDAQQKPQHFQSPDKVGGLRWALTAAEAAGGGYIVFDVAGTIQLRRDAEVPANVYIAGQSAPGGGIAVTGGRIVVRGRDVVIRNIRHRGGLKPEGDAILVNEPAANVVLDHVSVSFFRDGAVDTVGAKDVTIQWCHMGDAIDALTDEPYHGLPNLLRTKSDRITIHHCYYTHAHSRVPWFTPESYVKDDSAKNALIEFSNNVIYNYRKYPSLFTAPDGKGNAVGNLYVPGSHTHGGGGPRGAIDGGANFTIFVKDNIALSSFPDRPGHDGNTKGEKQDHHVLRGKDTPVAGSRPNDSLPEAAILNKPAPGRLNVAEMRFDEMPPITYQPLPQAVDAVMARFGALPHDATDQRLQKELLTHTGEWKMKMPEDKNVYEGKPAPDGDGDGMPDAWEKKKKGRDLAPNGHDLDKRYENIEVYLQDRMEQLVDKAAAVKAWQQIAGGK
jgi:hypothetical protein